MMGALGVCDVRGHFGSTMAIYMDDPVIQILSMLPQVDLPLPHDQAQTGVPRRRSSLFAGRRERVLLKETSVQLFW